MINTAMTYRITHQLSVFPLVSGGKRPLFNWDRFQGLRASFREIATWDASCNLAMATGSLSGVVIVDCESTADARWFVSQYSDTPIKTKTPRGYHLWFRHPGHHVPNAAKVPDATGQPRYDIRGDGGYVLLPPSKVVANAKDVKVSGEYQLIGDLSKLSQLPPFRMSWHRSSQRDDRAVKQGAKYIKHIRAVSGQGGHNETYRAVCRLKDSAMSEAEALAAMIEWNETNADPPWSMSELLHKVQSVYGKKR